MYSFPSTSQIFAPCACVTKNGAPFTLRNARTGELTPPGICFCAVLKSSDERDFKGKQTSNVQRPTSNIEFNCRKLTVRVQTGIVFPFSKRRGSQVVRSRSAKPLFAGSIPAPASTTRSDFVDKLAFASRTCSIDSLSPESSP
jgi:hypothetical protein